MKNFIKNFFLTGPFFGLAMGLLFGFTYSNVSIGIWSGVLSGTSFGLILAFFVYFQSRKFKKMYSTVPNLLFSDSANYFSNNLYEGGWLLLTTTQLIFKSHGVNLNSRELVIELKDITTIQTVPTLGIVPNGLLVHTIKKKERFVVHRRKDWISKILNAKKSL